MPCCIQLSELVIGSVDRNFKHSVAFSQTFSRNQNIYIVFCCPGPGPVKNFCNGCATSVTAMQIRLAFVDSLHKNHIAEIGSGPWRKVWHVFVATQKSHTRILWFEIIDATTAATYKCAPATRIKFVPIGFAGQMTVTTGCAVFAGSMVWNNFYHS